MSNNSNGSIKDIEREIDRDRSHFSETLRALENKFSPGQLVDQALGYAKRNGGDFSDNLVRTIASNPLPTILTGIGVAWMAMSQGRSSADSQYSSDYGYGYGSSYDTDSSMSGNGSSSSMSGKLSGAKDKAKGLKGELSNSAHQMGDRASHFAGDARNSANQMRERSRQQWARTSEGARQFFEENPLAVGAAAVAIGALIGASIPASAKERELLGDKGEEVINKAKSMAEDAKHTATEAGKAGAQAAKDRAKESTSKTESTY